MSPARSSGAAGHGHRFLLNFSASYYGGGYKRLQEYARWFAARGGAWFVIHPRCSALQEEFPGNRYFVVAHSHWERLLDDWSYLEGICRSIGQPDLYYAYGVPLYRPTGRINWSHVNNILTIGRRACPLPVGTLLKYKLLGRRIRRGFRNAQVISAESQFSLRALKSAGYDRLHLAINGADDELQSLQSRPTKSAEIATVVGTHEHKGLRDCLPVFRMLQAKHPGLRLMVIGDPRGVPDVVRNHRDTHLLGALPRADVIEYLRRSRYYISTTRVENSCNAASEGIFLAESSLISDIPPHAELLSGERFELASVRGCSRPLLRVERCHLRGFSLRSWDELITEMVATTYAALQRSTSELRSAVPRYPVTVS
jgi:glycosyltransferase involved in cell wall biosynthesis